MVVREIPRSFVRASPSNFRTQGSFIHINSGKIFERGLLSSDSVAKSATQNLGSSETDGVYIAVTITEHVCDYDTKRILKLSTY